MDDFRRQLVQRPQLRLITALMIAVILGLQGFMLWRERQDTWREGVREAENVLGTLSTAIERNLTVLELSLIGASEALDEPGFADLAPAMRNRLLFDRAISAEFLGTMLVLDAQGNNRFDSSSTDARHVSFADRDYFLVHKQPGVGTFVSTPFPSRMRDGDPSIGLSRRISGPDGAFRGVVAAAIRLNYFASLFQSVNLRRDSVLLLARADGTIIFREPAVGEPGRTLSGPAALGLVSGRPVSLPGPVVETSRADGVERVYVSRQVANFPLVLVMGTSIPTLFADWNQRALVTGLLALAICALIALTVGALGDALSRSEEMEAQLETLAVTDSLTGLPNRRAFDFMIDTELRRARRDKRELSLLMVDADHFKRVNDTHGHAAGDIVLRQIARQIQGAIRRPGDVATRYGGEEFVVILPATPLKGAERIAELVRAAIAGATFIIQGGTRVNVTVSVGVTSATPDDSPVDIVRRADDALYQAKGNGRNCVGVLDARAPAAAPAGTW